MRFFRKALTLVVVLVAGLTVFVLWGSSGAVDDPAWVDRYGDVTDVTPDTLTIMTYNIGYLSGMTNNRPIARGRAMFEANLEHAAGAVAQARPDVLALQEIDVASRRSFYVDQVEELARRGGYARAAVAVNWDERYVPFPSAWPPYHFGRMVSSQAIVSRFELSEHRRLVLPSPPGAALYGTNSWFARLAKRFYIDRLAQVVVVGSDRPIAVINVHLEAWDARTREAQVERLIALFHELRSEHAVIIAGDFNSVMPAARHPSRLAPEHLDRFRADRSLEHLLARTGLRGAMSDSVYATADADTYTFSSTDPQLKIDHVLFDPERFEAVGVRVLDVPGPPSDHRPVVARFVRRRNDAEN